MSEQSKLHSLFESINAAAFAAPTAILLHKLVLMIAGDNAINENQDIFITISWILFFFHGVLWKYIIRRIHDNYGYKIDPKYLIKNIYNRFKYGAM